MTDATRLTNGLEDFIAGLQEQSVMLREHGKRLEYSWSSLRDIYQGQGADQFANAFDRSRAMISNYQSAIDIVIPELQNRLNALRQFDAGNPAPE